MSEPSIVFRTGTRSSKLSLIQTRSALERLQALLPGVRFEEVHFSSPGDRDRVTDLRESPGDFFTRDLDAAVLAGELRFALHSAKDLPEPVSEGLDWVWLPGAEDRRDALVLPVGRRPDDLPPRPRMGVSSERRAAYIMRRWPEARIVPIRGNVEERVAQLDAGDFDGTITAAAALIRLDMQDRITQWLPIDELDTPEAQGTLALTFRADDAAALRLRSLLVKAVTFVGAGAGASGSCTLEGLEAIRHCDCCLHDALIDHDLLRELPQGAKAIDVGKRAGDHTMPQHEINALLVDLARKGRRVVRLKGGDPGIFGRLAEEVAALEEYSLPYRVIPGVSSLISATSGTGMLLTGRGRNRGFAVVTPRKSGGGFAPPTREARAELPVVLFMAVGCAAEVAAAMIEDGASPHTPAAFVFSAGTAEQIVTRGRLDGLREMVPPEAEGRPGLLIIGEIATGLYQQRGALQGARVLLTCSEALQPLARRAVLDLGGVPISRPLIELRTRPEARETIARIESFDWLVITSPSAVRCLLGMISECAVDLRRLPKIISCGPGTSREFIQRGIHPEAQPERDFGAASLLEATDGLLQPGTKVLRLRSDRAGSQLAEALRERGIDVTDCVLYDNAGVAADEPEPPDCEAIFFASSSAVEVFARNWGAEAASGVVTCAIGDATASALGEAGIVVGAIGPEATAASAIEALAGYLVSRDLEELR